MQASPRVIAGQNNMIEQGIFERDFFRKEMAKLDIAEIFIAPPFETWQVATNNDGANEKFNSLLPCLSGCLPKWKDSA